MKNSDFNLLPIGQKFIESCCSHHTFIKAVKVSETEIELLNISATTFEAYFQKKVFNENFDWLEPVNRFISADGKESTFEELKKLFL